MHQFPRDQMMIDTALIIYKVTGTSTFKINENIKFFFLICLLGSVPIPVAALS